MSEVPEPTANPETPWEFLDSEDQGDTVAPPAEEDAIHEVDPLEERVFDSAQDDPHIVVHYEVDEHPEVLDRSLPAEDDETTAEVEDLLIRQHYLPGEKG